VQLAERKDASRFPGLGAEAEELGIRAADLNLKRPPFRHRREREGVLVVAVRLFSKQPGWAATGDIVKEVNWFLFNP
jgi:hypothetical protein